MNDVPELNLETASCLLVASDVVFAFVVENVVNHGEIRILCIVHHKIIGHGDVG